MFENQSNARPPASPAAQVWIEHTDHDARLVRYYGPTSHAEAQQRADHLNRIPQHAARIVPQRPGFDWTREDYENHQARENAQAATRRERSA